MIIYIAENIEYVLLYLDEERTSEAMASIDLRNVTEKDFTKINKLVRKVGFALEQDDPSRGIFMISDESLRKDLFVLIWGILTKKSLYDLGNLTT